MLTALYIQNSYPTDILDVYAAIRLMDSGLDPESDLFKCCDMNGDKQFNLFDFLIITDMLLEDDKVDILDSYVAIRLIGADSGSDMFCLYDINQDGVINVFDFLMMTDSLDT